MSEIISGYKLDDMSRNIPLNRKDFYDGVVANHLDGTPQTHAVDIINMFLFNSHGEVIVQKRSFNKRHNPGQLDKSIGGHVTHGDGYDYTVMVETVQELQTPSIVLRTPEDFVKTHALLGQYLETIAIIRHVDTRLFAPKKNIDEHVIPVNNMVHLYMGVYDGRIRPVDREAKGVLYYTLDELDQEMNTAPNLFTDDLHVYMKTYDAQLREFVNGFCKGK